MVPHVAGARSAQPEEWGLLRGRAHVSRPRKLKILLCEQDKSVSNRWCRPSLNRVFWVGSIE